MSFCEVPPTDPPFAPQSFSLLRQQIFKQNVNDSHFLPPISMLLL